MTVGKDAEGGRTSVLGGGDNVTVLSGSGTSAGDAPALSGILGAIVVTLEKLIHDSVGVALGPVDRIGYHSLSVRITNGLCTTDVGCVVSGADHDESVKSVPVLKLGVNGTMSALHPNGECMLNCLDVIVISLGSIPVNIICENSVCVPAEGSPRL